MKRRDGYTILELLVTIAILALIAAIINPDFGTWVKRQSFANSFDDLYSNLMTVKSEAMTRGTTSRINLTLQVDGTYTISGYVSALPTPTCSSGAVAIQLFSRELSVPSGYQVTGNGVGNVCFYRDGSSTGGQYVYDDGGAGTGTGSISISVATGYLDVIKVY